MALTYSSFSSFDEVVNHYENVKPMGGISNKGKDVRPMGDRKRKYERIVKISDNCYALSEGCLLYTSEAAMHFQMAFTLATRSLIGVGVTPEHLDLYLH